MLFIAPGKRKLQFHRDSAGTVDKPLYHFFAVGFGYGDVGHFIYPKLHIDAVFAALNDFHLIEVDHVGAVAPLHVGINQALFDGLERIAKHEFGDDAFIEIPNEHVVVRRLNIEQVFPFYGQPELISLVVKRINVLLEAQLTLFLAVGEVEVQGGVGQKQYEAGVDDRFLEGCRKIALGIE